MALAASLPGARIVGLAVGGARARAPGCFSVDVAGVLGAVEALYRDELKPYGRILRKRIAEQAQAAGLGGVDIDIKHLRAICESSPQLSVQLEEGGDWSALLKYRAAAFVDVYSPRDLYPGELWHTAAAYFESLDGADMVLPGGRYSCAQVLISRSLPFLAGRSLGQVCHIVQLAISQKKLLGYLNGAVVPYSRSQSMVKERCAERQRPCTSAARGTSTLATWDMVRASLQDIFKGMGSTAVPLSNVKRLFRSRFRIELSETALGHAKLSELLQDPRLRDICKVRLQGHGYVVVPLTQSAPCNQISLEENLPSHRTTAKVEAAPVFPSRSHARWTPAPLCLDDIVPAEMVLPAGTRAALPETCHTEGSARDDEWQSALPPAFPVHTPSPLSAQHVQALPRLLGHLHPNPRHGLHSLPAACHPSKAAEVHTASSETCAGAKQAASAAEAMCGCSAEQAEQCALPPLKAECVALEARPLPVLTPCALASLGFSVQNTFIHAAVPPSTPPASAPCRSLSLPRNVGSGMALLRSPSRAARVAHLPGGEDARAGGGAARALPLTSQLQSQ